jgi:subtilisin family serine protease
MGTSHATRGLLLIVLAVVALAAAPASGARPGSVERFSFGTPRGQYVPGEVIVGFRAHASRADVARVHGRVPARVAQRFTGLRMQLLKLERGTSVQEAIRRYQQDPAVAFAEPNYIRHVNANLFTDLWGVNNTGQLHPVANSVDLHAEADHAGTNDTDIDAPEAWATPQQGNGTIVAVIDTGVDITHPDLVNQIWENPGESPNAEPSCAPNCDTDGVDTDDNGFVDDVHGYDFAEDDGDTLLDTNPHFPGFEHGTHVAGIIAGDNDNDGIVGVCPGCKIMVLKIARDSDGLLLESAELAALAYAKSMGVVKIANMSFGGPDWLNAEREAIRTSGLLAVVSAGNDALDNDMFLAANAVPGAPNPDVFSPSYPASFTLNNILAVGASNDEDRNGYSTECFAVFGSRAECAFTNWGHDSVDLAAPGVDVESSVPGGWETFDGTSMAAPHVAGAAGLVLSQNPTYTVAQLKNALMRSVDKPASLRTIYIPSYVDGKAHAPSGSFSRTTGRVNANTALTVEPSNATPLTDGNINGAKGMSTSSVTGSVAWPADINDVRKKRLSKGHRYRVTLVVPAGEDYDLFVWKPGTKEIWQIPGGTNLGRLAGASVKPFNGADEVVTFKAGSTGAFYFHVSAWLFKSGGYKLTVKRLS